MEPKRDAVPDESVVAAVSSQSECLDSMSDDDLIFELTDKLSLNRNVAVDLVREKRKECLRQLAHYPFYEGKYKIGKGAYWSDAIRNAYGAPKGYTEAQEASKPVSEREVAALNRVVIPPKDKAPIPPDWLPGVDEHNARSLCRQAFNRVRLIFGEEVNAQSIQVRDEARSIWMKLHPGVKQLWEIDESEPSQIRAVLTQSLSPTDNYSAQNTAITAPPP